MGRGAGEIEIQTKFFGDRVEVKARPDFQENLQSLPISEVLLLEVKHHLQVGIKLPSCCLPGAATCQTASAGRADRRATNGSVAISFQSLQNKEFVKHRE